MHAPRHTTASAVPIPRPPSQIRRPAPHILASESTTPLSHSPSSVSTSPFPFSPPTHSPHPGPASYATNLTTPPSIGSVAVSPPAFAATPGGTRTLSYPMVPPPSLSSSFGSPSTSSHSAALAPSQDSEGDGTPSPAESFHSRRNSSSSLEPRSVPRRGSFERRIAETGSLVRGRGGGSAGGSQSRRESVERGARLAETGSLVLRPRERAEAEGFGFGFGGLPLHEMAEDVDSPSLVVTQVNGSGSAGINGDTPHPSPSL